MLHQKTNTIRFDTRDKHPVECEVFPTKYVMTTRFGDMPLYTDREVPKVDGVPLVRADFGILYDNVFLTLIYGQFENSKSFNKLLTEYERKCANLTEQNTKTYIKSRKDIAKRHKREDHREIM